MSVVFMQGCVKKTVGVMSTVILTICSCSGSRNSLLAGGVCMLHRW